MAKDSVDDMYLGCDEAMMDKVHQTYLEGEQKRDAEAWKNAIEKVQKKVKDEKDVALTKLHLQAICVYTSNGVYVKFNKAVRTDRSNYRSSFMFHSLHYLLTTAIQILNSNHNCETTYRRTNVKLTGSVGQSIRLGSFASTSRLTNLDNFGNETCFEIKTCTGAYLKNYSCFEKNQEEVIIPPYEMFNITKKIDGHGKHEQLSDCKVVYVLESGGGKSELNCELIGK